MSGDRFARLAVPVMPELAASAARIHGPIHTVSTGAFVVGGLMIFKGLYRPSVGAPRKEAR